MCPRLGSGAVFVQQAASDICAAGSRLTVSMVSGFSDHSIRIDDF